MSAQSRTDIPRRRSETWWGFLRRFYRLWGFLLFLGLMLVVFRRVVLPFLLAIFIAYLLAPVVRRLEPKLTRAGAVIVSYLVLIAGMGAFFAVMLPAVAKDISRLRDSAPEIIDRVNREWLPRASEWLDDSFGELLATDPDANTSEMPQKPELRVDVTEDGGYAVDLTGVQLEVRAEGDGRYVIAPPGEAKTGLGAALKKLVASEAAELTSWLGALVQAAVAGTFSFLTSFIVTFMVAAFLLVDLARIRGVARAMVPPEYRDDFDALVNGVDRGMSGVIRGQLIICAVNGVLTYIGLLVFSVKYGLLLAILAGALSLVPIFGTIISSLPIMLIALVSDDAGGIAVYKSVAMLLWIIGIHLVEANFLNPKIIGDSAHMHPVVVIFALLAGESAYGLVGALLAVPAASMVQTIFLYARHQFDANWGSVESEADAAEAGLGEPAYVPREDSDDFDASASAEHRSTIEE